MTVGGVNFQDFLAVEADFSIVRAKKPDFPLVFIGANEMVKQKWKFDLNKNQWSVE